MRKRTRLATTAGVTVLGFTAMSGMAQADTGGLRLPVDLTGPLAKTPLGKTVDGVVKPSATRSSGLHLNLPLQVRLGAPQRSGHPAPAVHAGVKASVGTSPLSARVSLRLCAQPPQCRRVPSPPSPVPPSPPSPIPPAPPTPPPAPPVGNPLPPKPPAVAAPSSGSVSVIGGSLPFTGGPIGALTLIGATAVLAGAGGVAASRRKAGRTV